VEYEFAPNWSFTQTTAEDYFWQRTGATLPKNFFAIVFQTLARKSGAPGQSMRSHVVGSRRSREHSDLDVSKERRLQ
jgi:hypothetical protein